MLTKQCDTSLVGFRNITQAVTYNNFNLRYKPEGGGVDFRWCHWKFSLT
jgi:hypothetical protein